MTRNPRILMEKTESPEGNSNRERSPGDVSTLCQMRLTACVMAHARRIPEWIHPFHINSFRIGMAPALEKSIRKAETRHGSARTQGAQHMTHRQHVSRTMTRISLVLATAGGVLAGIALTLS